MGHPQVPRQVMSLGPNAQLNPFQLNIYLLIDMKIYLFFIILCIDCAVKIKYCFIKYCFISYTALNSYL